MKEAKADTCKKCSKMFYVHDHHILPKSIYGNGETERLCPNCHTHYHEYLKKQDISPENMEESLLVWYKWFYTVAIGGLVVFVLSLVW